MDSFLRDIRYALRLLRKSPGFTAVAVLTLSLGIVGTTIVFNAYNATVWQPLPAKDPERLTILERHFRKGGVGAEFSSADYRRFRDSSRAFSGLAAESTYDTLLARWPILKTAKFDEPSQALVKFVSDNYFHVLGVDAAAGRVFSRTDSEAPVAVLSYGAWHRRFREDPAVIGQSVFVYGTSVTIIGVAPAAFVGSGNPPIAPDLWMPTATAPMLEPNRRTHFGQEDWLRIVGRLQPGTTPADVQHELTGIQQQGEKERGIEITTAAVVAGPAYYFIRPGDPHFRAIAALLLASFGMVLLVACANMANLFIARSTVRRREMAVRTALGASRWDLIRQLLTEGILLGVTGGAVAMVASWWICRVIWMEVEQRVISRFTDLYQFTFSFTPSWRVVAATFVISAVAGALFSLTGAVQASHTETYDVMKGAELTLAPTRRYRVKIRDLLIGVQVTLSVILLVTAALLTRGMVRGQTVEPGFNTHNVLNIEFTGLEAAGYDTAKTTAVREELLRRLERTAGVEQVAVATHVPLLGFTMPDVAKPGGKRNEAYGNDVSPGFFSTMGIPLVRGRDFTPSEVEHSAPVIVISQATARNLWPGEDPVGKWILVGTKQRPMQVIGEAGDVRSISLGTIAQYFLYMPITPDAPLTDIFLRVKGSAGAAIPEVLKTTAEVDRRLASLASTHTMEDMLWLQHLPSTISTLLAAFVGALALVLASVGIYGTVAYTVAQRTREIGIRIALGARRSTIIRLVLKHTMTLVGVSATIGLMGSVVVARAIVAVPFGLQSMLLFGISPRDPLTMASVAALLLFVAAAAAYRPAAKAARVDPMVALRYE